MQVLKYMPVLDGIRGLAVLAVLLFHLDLFSGGYLGVDVFFVISGYLITKIILEEKKQNVFSFKNFYIKRFKRLFPALSVVIILSLLTAIIIFDTDNLLRFNESSFYSLFFLSNIFFWTESNYFDTSSNLKPLLHTWSLGIEMTFYLIFPIFLILLMKIKSMSIRKSVIFLIIFLSSIFVIFLNTKKPIFDTLIFDKFLYGKYIEDTLFFLFPFRFFEFLIGSLIVFIPDKKLNKISSIFFNLSFFGLIFIFFVFDEKTNFLLRTILTCVLTSILIFYRSNKLNYILNNAFVIKTGTISYSLYLVHWPIIIFTKYFFFNELNNIKIFVIVLFSFMLAQLSYSYIEKPLRKIYDAKKKMALSFFVLIYLSLFLSTNFYDGYKFKISEDNLAKINTLNKDRTKEFCDKKFSSNDSLKEQICVHGLEENSKLVILGDSNGTMWFPGFKQIAIRNNIGIVSYSRVCFNFPFLNTDINNEFEKCDEVDLENKILVLGAQWFNFQNEDEFNYSKNIARLKQNKNFQNLEKIIVMGQIPNYLRNIFDIKTCYSRPYYLKKIDCINYFNSSLNDNEYLEKIKKFNERFNSQLLNNKDLSGTDILFIDPVDNLCQNNCVQFIDEKLAYLDENHISSAASEYIINENLRLIETFIKK